MNLEMASQAGRVPSFCSMLSAAVTHAIVRSRVSPIWPTPAWKALSLQSSSFLNLTPMGCAEADPYSSMVVRSPGSMPSSRALRTRRMILPERVLGNEATNSSSEGVAMGPSS